MKYDCIVIGVHSDFSNFYEHPDARTFNTYCDDYYQQQIEVEVSKFISLLENKFPGIIFFHISKEDKTYINEVFLKLNSLNKPTTDI